MSGHTPGPWTLETVQTSVGWCHKVGPFPWKNGKENHACVYDDYASGHNGTPELIANARLIAAAPELLSDLCDAAATLRRYESLHRAKNTEESTAKAEVNAALATRFERTIAKAKGEA